MTEEQVRQIAREVMRESENRFYMHRHTGGDNQKVSLSNLSQGILFGQITLSNSGVATIVNPKINKNTIGVAMSSVQHSAGTFDELSGAYLSGTTFQFNGQANDLIFYILVTNPTIN